MSNIPGKPQECLTQSLKHGDLRLMSRPYKVPELPVDDYNRLNNLYDFQFKINAIGVCNNTNVFLLVLVTSAVQNHKIRHAIRTTWGQTDSTVKTLFMLGEVDEPNLKQLVKLESETYGDIIQGSFKDSYRNLTYKTIMALKYVIYHCQNATYILKTDDDVFVNMPLMKNYLTNDLSPFGANNLLQCHVVRNAKVYRGSFFEPPKWSVTKEELSESIYPTYCKGPYALLSPDVVFKLYKQAQKTRFFFIEDVFMYGFVASKYPEIKHLDMMEVSLWNEYVYKLSSGAFDKKMFLFGTAGMSEAEIREFWNYVIRKPVPSSIYGYCG